MLHDSSLALTAQVEKVAAAATPDLFFSWGGGLLLICLNGPEAFRATRSRSVASRSSIMMPIPALPPCTIRSRLCTHSAFFELGFDRSTEGS